MKKLPKTSDQFVVIEKKSDSRAVFFEGWDTLGRSLDLEDESWLIDATRMYLERREPKTNWDEVFAGLRAVCRSSRLSEGWERDGDRLFLAPILYSEALLIQYLVSRSHAHGGLTTDGRLTLMDLIRRLRYYGYLDHIGITEHEPGEVFEKLIDHLASSVSTASGSDRPRVSTASGSDWARVSTASGSDRPGVKQQAKKSSKPRKDKALPPESDE